MINLVVGTLLICAQVGLLLICACTNSTTEPTDVPPTLRWEAAGQPPTGNPGGPCLYVSTAAGVQPDAGTIALAVRVQNLHDVKEITGGLVYSRTVLKYIGWHRGGWLDDPECAIAHREGIVTFELRGHTPRSGSGEVLVLMFRAAEGARGESTRILWYTPRVNGSSVAVLGGAVYVE